MSKNQLSYEGTINKKYIKKEMVKSTIILSVIFIGIFLFIWLLIWGISLDEGFPYPTMLLTFITITTGLIPFSMILISSYAYEKAYVKNFYYVIQEDSIVIHHGVFTKVKATIPYSRVQNINITNGVFDRMFNLFTVKVETAGSSAAAQAAQGGVIRPEGYIPGLENPNIIEEKISEMMTKYSNIPSGLEDKVFKPEELAFDNFISYILSKMREGEKLKTSIKDLREQQDMSAAKLAESVGVPIQTINFLEEGRYNPSILLAYKIAETLNCKVEDLFKVP
ncbi:MAG: PH domain-containing protein [Candidatus Lokiarchaeota archaeon]|nr:PH domain-containing protein [Candidatus Lokiarchaeota archaeon]MBD3198774.1 PH domain-containing protein [Candidatus Lokiarchaeota archaeon]